MKTNKKIIIGIIIVLLIIGIFYFFGLIEINPTNKSTPVGVFILRKFGESQMFDIEKIVDQGEMDFGGYTECEEGFLERNPTFNKNVVDEKETYYCEVIYTGFYKNGIDKFLGRQTCSCYYKK